MINRQAWMKAAALAGASVVSVAANADPVVYTLRTVADGQLGSRTFYEALVTIRMISDTGSVQSQSAPNGQHIYTNRNGTATVTVDDGYRTTFATFAPGEVYVRYDTYTGVVGFGSPISPTYPISLGCTNYGDSNYTQDCAQGDWGPQGNLFQNGQYNGTADAQADIAFYSGDSVFSSDAALNLPADLTQTTLLTGRAHSCATNYALVGGNELGACPSAAPRGLHTDKGGFYLQDQYGIFFANLANTGALQVEVFKEDE
jgi:hypothetical protein